MSHLRPNYDDDELKGSVDFDFFADGSESARRNEDDQATPKRSARSSEASSVNRASKASSGGAARSPDRQQGASPPSHRQAANSSRSSSRSRSPSTASVAELAEEPEDKEPPPPPAASSRSPTPDRRRRRSGGSSASTSSASSASSSSSSSSSASDVTDVSPLSSPRRGLGDADGGGVGGAAGTSSGKPPRVGGVGSARREEEPGAGVGERDEDRINMETIVRALVELDKRRCQSAGARRPGLNSGTQSMSRIHDIEAENQRLLYNLMRTKTRKAKQSDIDPPAKRPHHSTVNRQREQRRIEEENRKIFQRLKGVKATKGMSRDEMITDYKRQASFGLPLYMQGIEVKNRPPRITQNPYCQPVTRVHSSSSMVHRSGGSRPSSATSAGRPQSGASGAGGGGGSRGAAGGGVSSERAGWPAGW